MGWKKFKQQYQIRHIVHVVNNTICIGSEFVTELAHINSVTGKMTDTKTFGGFLKRNYPALLEANPDDIRKCINEPDIFASSNAVYTYEKSDIIEKVCEEYGWPNVTHDGVLMFENVFFKDRSSAINKALENAGYIAEHFEERIITLALDIENAKGELSSARSDIAHLESLKAKCADSKTGCE